MPLYEVLIPRADNRKRPFSAKHHAVWQAEVRRVAGGLTVGAIVEGQWASDGKVYKEKMQVVRIACNARKIATLVRVAKRHYRQLAVMYYPVSRDVRFI